MADKKRIATTIGAMALAATLAVGGTLAFLQKVTDTKVNAFSSSNNIIPELKEEFNEDDAANYEPGEVITKKPTVSNVSEKDGETMIAGIAVQYTLNNEEAKLADVSKYVTIKTAKGTFDTDLAADWMIAQNNSATDVYMYNKVLAKGDTTDAIFDSVDVREDLVEYLLWEKYGSQGTTLYYIDAEAENPDFTVTTKTEVEGNTTTKYTTKYVAVNPAEDYDTYKASVNNKTQYYTLTNVPSTGVDAEFASANVTLPKFDIKVTGLAIQTDGFVDNGVIGGNAKTELVKLAEGSLTK